MRAKVIAGALTLCAGLVGLVYGVWVSLKIYLLSYNLPIDEKDAILNGCFWFAGCLIACCVGVWLIRRRHQT